MTSCTHPTVSLILPPDRRVSMEYRWECDACYTQLTDGQLARLVQEPHVRSKA